jgi:hypothetical protein
MRLLLLCLGLFALAPAIRAQDTPPEQPTAKQALTEHTIPFTLTKTQHIMVRVKINGKGPFNLIVDTGAPIVIMTESAAKKAGVEPDRKNWTKLDRFEIEGGLKVEEVRTRVEDIYQLRAMNGMGLPGVELHGIIGYTVLSKYRIEVDLTSDSMTWTKLNFNPPPLNMMGGNKGGADGGLEALGKLLGGKGAAKLPEPRPRGFLGVELAEKDERVTVTAVHPKSPAEKAGLKVGDRIVTIDERDINSLEMLYKRANRRAVGDEMEIEIEREGEKQTISVTFGKGL